MHPACPGKYDELLQIGYNFAELVAAHDSSMELVESAALTGNRELRVAPLPETVQQDGGGQRQQLAVVIVRSSWRPKPLRRR